MIFKLNYNLIIPHEFEVWYFILGVYVNPYQRFRNPRRSDNNAGAIFKKNYGNFHVLLDPSDILHGKNCINAIMIVYNKNFSEALEYIMFTVLKNKKLSFTSKTNDKIEIKTKPFFDIRVENRKWSYKDGDYWKCVSTSKELINEKCLPVKNYWLPRNSIYYKYKANKFTYSNRIENKIKIYSPIKRLFLTNITYEIGGFKEITSFSHIIITKNLKSYLAISQKYNCRYVPCESSLLSNKFKEFLNKFESIYYLVDNDDAGYLYAERLANDFKGEAIHFEEQGTYQDLFNQTKKLSDAYDLTYKYGIDIMFEQLKYLL